MFVFNATTSLPTRVTRTYPFVWKLAFVVPSHLLLSVRPVTVRANCEICALFSVGCVRV